MKQYFKKHTMALILGFLFLFALPLTLFYGHYLFYNSVKKEVASMFNASGNTELLVMQQDLKHLPQELQNYLHKVGVVGACIDCHVSFKQTGQIKTRKDKNWANFTATQYMTADVPNFIWSAKSYPMFIRDKSLNGKGEVKVNLFGFKDVVKGDGFKTDESALARCLGELLFYPVGFLSDSISWEEIDDKSVKATIKVGDTKAEGIFYFNEDGLLYRFKSKRYMDQSLEDFTGIAEDYTMMNGFFIPTKMRAIWNLADGDFEYFKCTITNYHIE